MGCVIKWVVLARNRFGLKVGCVYEVGWELRSIYVNETDPVPPGAATRGAGRGLLFLFRMLPSRSLSLFFQWDATAQA